LQAAYALTSAESHIARHLVDRRSADLIAGCRCAAVGTIREQIKAITAKVGVMW
jgi:DNA-binding CsgD family transcriptional regulator